MKILKIILIAFVITLPLIISENAQAFSLIDTSAPTPPEGWVFSATLPAGSEGFAAQFTVPDFGHPTLLTHVGTWFGTGGGDPGTGSLTAVLYSDGGDIPGAELFSQSTTITSAGLTTLALGPLWAVTPGDYWLAFEIRAGDTFSGSIIADSANNGDPNLAFLPQTDEAQLESGIYTGVDTLNIGLQIQAITTPEPMTMATVGLGLLGGGIGFRKRKKALKA